MKRLITPKYEDVIVISDDSISIGDLEAIACTDPELKNELFTVIAFEKEGYTAVLQLKHASGQACEVKLVGTWAQ
jgi:hypothetical protein